ncbi:MAG: hypothetical protein C0507_17200 [Cyanobacteria bacterium PR.3.49]|jgi:hypothetical protein|nr:hypothetical protein [Cyanobacteria bacterium PR.3.49]
MTSSNFDFASRIMCFVLGLTFLGGGLIFVKQSLDAKNLIESVLFSLMGVMAGLFLIVTAIMGPPDI